MTSPPEAPYVGLYGSHGGDWRQRCRRLLDEAGVPWHDPSDPRWEDITHETGDRHQHLIDDLVAEELTALHDAACVIFHLGGRGEGEDGAEEREPPAALASRFELGVLAGLRTLPTFVHVDRTARGRNYLWAALHLYPNLHRCDSLEQAVERAVRRMEVGG